jgi:hypothetical protein
VSGLRSASPVLVVLGLALAGCGTTSDLISTPPVGSGTALGNLFRFGTVNEPPLAKPVAEEEDPVACPPISILPGGAAVRLGGAGSESVRSQITITDVARECQQQPGGALLVRVGAEGRVLAGPAGGAGGQFASLRIEVRRGGTTIATRTVRVGGSIPAGQSQTGWLHVENGIQIPAAPSGGDTDIFMALGQGGPEPRQRRR